MERRTKWAAFSIAACLGAAGVHAEDEGFYAGLALGKFKQSVQSGDWVVYDAGSGSVVPGIRIDSDNGDLGGALSLGYRLNRYFAAELSFLNAGTADQTNRFGNLGTATRSAQITGPVLSVLPSFELGSNVRAYVRTGVLFAHEKFEYEGGYSETLGDTTWIAGAGLEYTLTDRWNMNVEYLRSGDLDEPADSGGNHLSGLTLGVKYKF